MLKLFGVCVISLVMVCGLNGAPAMAQTSDDAGTQGDLLFPVQAEDSLTNLFGADWQRVFNNNCSCHFRDWEGDASSPNFLLVGTVLKVPDDTYLTPRAQGRIEAIKAQRAGLHDRLAALENAGGETGARAAKLDQVLSSDGYVGDLDRLSHATALLETINQEYASATSVEVQRQHTTELIVSGVAALAISFAWLWAGMRRRKPVRPTGDNRMLAALKALDKKA